MPDVGAELLGLGAGWSAVVSVTVPLPAELLTYWGSGTVTDTTVLRPAPNPRNYAPTSGMPYYEYICSWVDYF